MTGRNTSVKIMKALKGVLLLIIVVLIAAAFYINSLIPIITGYAAKNLASGVFVSGRTQEDMEATDLNFSFIAFNKNKVNIEDKSVTSRFLWGRSTALYRDGFGVTLLRDVDKEELRKVIYPENISAGYSCDTLPWPMGDMLPDTVVEDIDVAELSMITEDLIKNDAYGGSAYAFMVLHRGIPVAEAYKKRFDPETRFLSWSMGKSITNGLIGVLSGMDRISINDSALLPEWTNNEKSPITLNNLIQMQSGLHWNEDYGNRSDVTVMLHMESDFARFAYEQELEFEPGTHWYYSSGTTNIVSYIMRGCFETDADYYSFPQKEFFYRIGITDAVFEVDPSGTLIGSSYIYMTARDYARFALLYAGDGIFCGNRILPEGWVDYTRETASASDGEYGSFFWLNRAGAFPSCPEDMYMCTGHDGQQIFILPSQELVVVVLGYSPDKSMDFDRLVSDIVLTVGE